MSDVQHSNPPTVSEFARDIISLRPILAGYAHKLCRNDPDAEDLLQETIARALRYKDRFMPGTNLKAWLMRVMKNLFITQRGLRQREIVWSIDDVGSQLTCLPQQEWIVYQAEAARVIDAMPADRRLALLQVSAGVPYEDVAKGLGCEVGTIKSRVSRARTALTAQFGDIFNRRDAYSVT